MKREPDRLASADETDPVDYRLVVVPVPRRGSSSLGYEALLFVEANGRGGKTDLVCDFTDLHEPDNISLDLQPYLKLYGPKMQVTLQYIDGCPNWKTTSALLAALVEEGLSLTVHYVLIDSHEVAVARGFRGSPTVLIDGVDPFADEDAPFGLACRIYRTGSELAGSPSLSQLRNAIATSHKE